MPTDPTHRFPRAPRGGRKDKYEENEQTTATNLEAPQILAAGIWRRWPRRRIRVHWRARRRKTTRTALCGQRAADPGQTAGIQNEVEDHEGGDLSRQTPLALPQSTHGRRNRRPGRADPRRPREDVRRGRGGNRALSNR